MQSTIKALFTYIILLPWFIICLIIFVYVSHIGYVQIVSIFEWDLVPKVLKSISPASEAINLFIALLGVMLFSLACISLGMAVLQKQAQSQMSNLVLWVTAFITGEILYSLIFLAIISLYKLTPVFVASILAIGFLAGIPSLRSFNSRLSFRSRFSTAFELNEQIILVLLVSGFMLGLFLSFARLGYDATAEYFSQAKIMAISNLPIFYYPKDYFVVSSFHPGILFTALIQLFGDQSARILPWVNGAAILLMGLAIIKELGLKPRSMLWFVAMMVTTTAFMDLLGDGKIELISTAPILAAVYWMLYSLEHPTKDTFLLIGLLVGFAIISRPYNIFLASVFVMLFYASQVTIQIWKKHFNLKNFIQLVLWMPLPILLLGVFHLLENWFFLGSPLAPLTYARNLNSNAWQWQLDPANLNLYRFLYPLTLTFLNSPQSLGNISPLLVGSLPFLLIENVRSNLHIPPRLRTLLFVSIATLFLWIIFFFTILEIRYVLFLWVILFIVTAQVFESMIQYTETLVRVSLRFLLVVFLIAGCVRTSLLAIVTYFPLNEISEGRGFCWDDNLCPLLERINQPAAPGDRVLVLHAYRYYLRSDLFACSSQVEEYYKLEPFARQNSPNFWIEAYRLGFRYIMFQEHLSVSRYNFGELPDLDTAPDWIHVKVLYSSPKTNQLVYEIEPIKPPISPELVCNKNTHGIWEVQTINH